MRREIDVAYSFECSVFYLFALFSLSLSFHLFKPRLRVGSADSDVEERDGEQNYCELQLHHVSLMHFEELDGIHPATKSTTLG